MLIKILITFAVFAGLLFLLTRIFKDFILDVKAIIPVTLILMLTDFLLGKALYIVTLPVKFVTLGLLNFLINWLINVAVFWATDRFSDSLTIKSKTTLFLSAIFLQLANWVIKTVT